MLQQPVPFTVRIAPTDAKILGADGVKAGEIDDAYAFLKLVGVTVFISGFYWKN